MLFRHQIRNVSIDFHLKSLYLWGKFDAMTITEFNSLTFDGKASLLTKYGRYLDERSTTDGCKILIHDLFGFYVEVSYRFDRKVQYIRAVNNIFESEPYLESINLLHLN